MSSSYTGSLLLRAGGSAAEEAGSLLGSSPLRPQPCREENGTTRHAARLPVGAHACPVSAYGSGAARPVTRGVWLPGTPHGSPAAGDAAARSPTRASSAGRPPASRAGCGLVCAWSDGRVPHPARPAGWAPRQNGSGPLLGPEATAAAPPRPPRRRALRPIGRGDPRKGRGHSPRRAHAPSASRLRVGPRDAHPRVPPVKQQDVKKKKNSPFFLFLRGGEEGGRRGLKKKRERKNPLKL